MISTVSCFIGLGSNQQHPVQQLTKALNSLNGQAQINVVAHSSFYQSTPLVSENSQQPQSNYINSVAKITTTLAPFQLLSELQNIETNQGRVRDNNNRWGARTLDLDILLYGDKVIQTQALIIPHYAMKQRDFVLQPLLEICREFIFPDGSKASQLLQQCENNNLTKMVGICSGL